MKKNIMLSNGIKVLGAAVLGIVLSVAVFMPVKARDLPAGNIDETALSETEENFLTGDTVLTINNDKTIDGGIVLQGHDLTIEGTKTLTINGRIRPGDGYQNIVVLTISGGVKIEVTNNGNGATVYVNELIVNGGSLEATYGGNQNGVAAIHAYSSIAVNSGKIKGTSTRRGISSGGTVRVTGGEMTAEGESESGLFSSAGPIEISGDNTIVNCTSTDLSGIHTNTGTVTISGGRVNATGGGSRPGIGCYGDVSVTGEKTVVKATTSAGASAIRSNHGAINIDLPLKIIKPAGGRIDGGEIRKSDDSLADDIEIKKPESSGGKDNTDKTDKDDEKSDDEESDEVESQDESKPAVVNYDAIHVLSITGFPYGTFFAKQDQGLAAKHSFTLALPKGYQEAFTFNMITNGHKGDYSLKKGKFTIEIPAKYRRAGRIFALQVIDRSGDVLLLPDKDDNPYSISVDVNVEGYAFNLIYSDF